MDQPLPEEETIQSQLDEDLAIPDSSPRASAPPSPHEDDVERLIIPQLSPLPSPVGTDDVDEHIDLCASPQLPNESPDPLDIITPADDDGEDEPSPHERAAAVQPSPSPPRPFEGSERSVSAEPILNDDAEPPETAETQETSDSLEHPKPSEAAERSDVDDEIMLDESAAASTSQAIEDEMSGVGRSEMDSKDNVSIRSLSEPPGIVRPVELPAPLDDEATNSAPGTPILDILGLKQGKCSTSFH